jgi:phosphoglucomutase/phosphopentomutase
MPGTTLDKDGVSVAAIFAEIANYLHERQLKISDQLFEIFKKCVFSFIKATVIACFRYGFHLTRNSYYIVPTKDTTKAVFEKRSRNPPKTINSVKVKDVRDLTVYATTKTSVNTFNYIFYSLFRTCPSLPPRQ